MSIFVEWCKKHRVVLILISSAVIAVLAALIVVLSSVFPKGSFINGIDVSSKTVFSVKRDFNKNYLPVFSYTVVGIDGEKMPLVNEDVDWSYRTDALRSALKIFKNNDVSESDSLEILPEFNEEKLAKILDRAGIMNGTTMPIDAYIEKDKDNWFVIVPETTGNILNDKPLAIEYCVEKIKRNIQENLYDCDVNIPDVLYRKAPVQRDDARLLADLDKLNELAGKCVIIDMGGELREYIYQKDYSDISVDGTVEFHPERVGAYVDWLKATYDTKYQDRTITLPDKTVVTVKGTPEDTFGYDMDRDATVEEIIHAIKENIPEIFALHYTGGATREGNGGDVGDSYIFVNLTKQKLIAVKDGEVLVESDIVSGLKSDENRRTPTGIFGIWQHEQGASLTGTESNGDAYESYVYYWLAIDFRGHGLHDALWRDKFGGKIYETDGSHGCINLPIEVAQTLYYNYDIGDPVLIYEEPASGSVVPGK